jgi:hypothetical protein
MDEIWRYCIPDLEFDVVAAYCHCLGSELDSDGYFVFVTIAFICVLEEET